MAADPSLSVSTILKIYTAAEIDTEINRLKVEFRDLYNSVSGGGKAGERKLEFVRADLEAFGQAKAIKCGGAVGLITTQARFDTGPSSAGEPFNSCGGNYDGGLGV